ncbi:MAG: hypothetical protein Q9222_007909, partial [Ikaeria aurantiellina]
MPPPLTPNNNNRAPNTIQITCPNPTTASFIEKRITTLITLALYTPYTFAQIGQILASQGQPEGVSGAPDLSSESSERA